MRYKKDIVVIVFLAGLIIFTAFVIDSPEITGKAVSIGGLNLGGVSSNVASKAVSGGGGGGGAPRIKTVPLSAEEREKVAQTLLSSEFIKDVPEKNPIALTFYSFENGQKILRDSFLIGKNQLLRDGKPAIFLTLHSKYISEFNGQNLCEMIRKAQNNGDLGFNSEHGNAKLLIKYAGMLKHRECFGF